MKFIEISDTTCVNTDSIEWITSVDEGMSSLLSVRGKEYPSDIPYKSLIMLLKQGESNPVMEKLDKYLSVATIPTV